VQVRQRRLLIGFTCFRHALSLGGASDNYGHIAARFRLRKCISHASIDIWRLPLPS